MNEPLMSCPFCSRSCLEAHFDDTHFYFIECCHCQARGPSAGTRADAERYWNERESKPLDTASNPAYPTDSIPPETNRL